jgi:hypothetical protein
MGRRDPRVDAYIAKSADFSRPILETHGLLQLGLVRRLVAMRCLCAAMVFVATQTFAQSPGAMQQVSDLMAASKWAEAAAALEGIVATDSSNGAAWLQLARAYDETKQYDREVEAALRVVDLGFRPGLAWLAVARGQMGRGDRDAALQAIERVAAAGSNPIVKARIEATPAFEPLESDPRWAAAMRALTPCTAAEYRQFDFWLGDFRVEDHKGNHVGDNQITSHLGGCMLMEGWKGAGGMHGMSMNFYDPADGTWNQVFVDNLGKPANWPPLKGRFESGAMVLHSPAASTPRTRWTWTPLGDGRVRQMAESSSDGTSWTVTWDSYYVPKK